MTVPLLIALPGNERLAADLATALDYELGQIETRQFPDGETYLRFITNPTARSVAIACTLVWILRVMGRRFREGDERVEDAPYGPQGPNEPVPGGRP